METRGDGVAKFVIGGRGASQNPKTGGGGGVVSDFFQTPLPMTLNGIALIPVWVMLSRT